jgi:hypothetical protein
LRTSCQTVVIEETVVIGARCTVGKRHTSLTFRITTDTDCLGRIRDGGIRARKNTGVVKVE